MGEYEELVGAVITEVHVQYDTDLCSDVETGIKIHLKDGRVFEVEAGCDQNVGYLSLYVEDK